jgi:hypothetical protein
VDQNERLALAAAVKVQRHGDNLYKLDN